MPRKKTPTQTETEVLLKSARRCCFCYGLHHDFDTKKGQIAHLDQNNQNTRFENLAWLCLEHHDEYDGKTSQSKGLTLLEAKEYRKRLYEEIDSRWLGRKNELQKLESVSAANTTVEKTILKQNPFSDDLICEVTFEADDSMIMLLKCFRNEYVGPFFLITSVHSGLLEFRSTDPRQIINVDANATLDGRDAYAVGFQTVLGPVSPGNPLELSLHKLGTFGPRLSFLKVKSDKVWKDIPMIKVADFTKKRA